MTLSFNLNNQGMDLKIITAMAMISWALAICQAFKPEFSMSFLSH